MFPFIEQNALFTQIYTAQTAGFGGQPAGINAYGLAVYGQVVKGLICPSDPTTGNYITTSGNTVNGITVKSEAGFGVSCYAANVLVFTPNQSSLALSMPNGTSNTSVIAERYSFCYANGHIGGGATGTGSGSGYWVHWAYLQPGGGDEQAAVGYGWATTNAEAGPWGQPIFYSGGCPGADFSWTSPTTGVTKTIQVRPNMNPPTDAQAMVNGVQVTGDPNGCDSLLTQTGHSGGMTVGMGDGSVRTVSGSISPATWRTVGNDPAYAGMTPGADW